MEITREQFTISDEKALLQPERIYALLARSYWAETRILETIRASIEHSLCFGAYGANGEQIGFARCVTDYATMFWLADVIVDERFRRMGVGKALVDAAVRHERLRGLTGLLATRDAQELYGRFGFTPVDGRLYMRKTPEQPQSEPPARR